MQSLHNSCYDDNLPPFKSKNKPFNDVDSISILKQQKKIILLVMQKIFRIIQEELHWQQQSKISSTWNRYYYKYATGYSFLNKAFFILYNYNLSQRLCSSIVISVQPNCRCATKTNYAPCAAGQIVEFTVFVTEAFTLTCYCRANKPWLCYQNNQLSLCYQKKCSSSLLLLYVQTNRRSATETVDRPCATKRMLWYSS